MNKIMTKNKIPFILLIFAFFAISIPIFKVDMWFGHDVAAHYQRAIGTISGVSNFQIPPLFDFFNEWQLGYSWNLFYPPLTSMLFGLITLLSLNTASVFMQLKIATIIITAISIITSYYMGSYFYKRRDAGAITSILFITSSYFLNNYYIRFSIGEMMAHALIPLLIIGVDASIENKKEKILLPISASLILLSNIPSIIVSVIGCFFLYLFRLNKIANKGFLLFSLCSAAFIILSTSFYTIPLVYEKINDNIWAFSNINNSFQRMWELAPSLSDILTGDDNLYDNTSKHVRSHRTHGIPITILFFIGAVLLCKNKRINYLIPASLLLTLMASKAFPWYGIGSDFSMLTYIQFPWRILMFSGTIYALIATYPMILLFEKKSIEIFLSILAISVLYTSYITNVALHKEISNNDSFLMGVYRDYLPNDGNSKIIKDKRIEVSNNADIYDVSFTHGYPTYTFKKKINSVEIPVIKNKLLNVYVNGNLNKYYGDGYFISVTSKDEIKSISIKPNPIIYLGYAISVTSFLASLIYIRKKRNY
ncbi:hypothetical protein [Morganella morganii]|uniref:hypothetical protein n=1 Tax=Morganella morganii TaxID=582 RepID=UPI0014194F0F|nr:hypothetical protein [Morganella morganii]NIH18428.1 hypothetical protein [Morganella morganii]